MKNKKFSESLRHAFDGVIYTAKLERNFRFDIAAALYVIWFSTAYGLSRAEWAVIAAVIGAMLVVETINTAVEQAVDAAVHGYEIHAKHAKDAAAGASLIFAVASAIIALIIFLDFDRLFAAFMRIIKSPVYIASFVLISLLTLWLLLKAGKKNNKE